VNTSDMLAEDCVRFCHCTEFVSINKIRCILIEDVVNVVGKHGLTCLCE